VYADGGAGIVSGRLEAYYQFGTAGAWSIGAHLISACTAVAPKSKRSLRVEVLCDAARRSDVDRRGGLAVGSVPLRTGLTLQSGAAVVLRDDVDGWGFLMLDGKL
jgi:hypothetical protein